MTFVRYNRLIIYLAKSFFHHDIIYLFKLAVAVSYLDHKLSVSTYEHVLKRKINPDMSSLMQRHQLQLTAVKPFGFFEIICILVKEILLDCFCLFLYFLINVQWDRTLG